MSVDQGLLRYIVQALREDHLLLFFTAFMLALAAIELLSLFWGKRREFKSSIVTIGVLGTFFGVFVGLAGFDTENISGSIPQLLSGLRLAFLTSIVGMALAIALSVIETLKGESPDEDTNELTNISQKLSLLESLDTQLKMNSAQQETYEARRTAQHSEMQAMLEGRFAETNSALKEALETLSRGATEEVIKALQGVIADFNANLTAQFGENFKQLNSAVARLLTWQENYKAHIDSAERHLSAIQGSLQQSEKTIAVIAASNQETQQIYKKLGEQIERYDRQVHALNAQLEAYLSVGTRAASAFTTIDGNMERITQELDRLTVQIQTSLTSQSEALAQLMREIETKLPDSLGQLESTLSGITSRFGRDYESFLRRINDLLPR